MVMRVKESQNAINFKAWLYSLMRNNGIKSYDELCTKLGCSRKTLYNWINEPEKIKRYALAGLMYILDYSDDSVDEMCDYFNIARL